MEEMKLFAFKRALFNISSKLSDSDLGKMKFILADFLPRRELEKCRSGFDLLCLMASRSDILSCENYSFLEEVLREVGKEDIVRTMVLASSSSPAFNTSPVVVPEDKKKLLQVKRFLADLADNLTAENVRDMCQFFAGICKSINYLNLHSITSGEQLFSKLLESELIGFGQLQPLQLVLSIIGRLDLSTNVEAFSESMWPVGLAVGIGYGIGGMFSLLVEPQFCSSNVPGI